MIQLGEIRVRDSQSVVDTRNKMFGLTQTLRLDRINATRIAASMSQAVRVLLKAGLNPTVRISIQEVDGKLRMHLAFSNTARPQALTMLEPFFDELVIANDGGSSTAVKYLPADAKFLDDRLLKQERERINRKSRGELMDELRLKNQELQEYNERLEETVAQRTAELKLANEHMRSDLNAGARYIQNLIPPPMEGPIATDWRYIPSANLGGDAFGYHWIDDDNLAIYMLDVTGHGIDSALLAVTAMHFIRSGNLGDIDMRHPGNVLIALNRSFPSAQQDGKLFTIWYGVYCPSRAQLAWAGGGHPPAVLVRHGNARHEFLDSTGPIVGALSDAAFDYHQVRLQPPARLYVYSDGVHEVKLADGRRWTYQELAEFLNKQAAADGRVLDLVLQHTRNLGGSERFEDDFSIVEMIFNDA